MAGETVITIVGRSPHGERGLKCRHGELRRTVAGRSPHGERGLKSVPGRRPAGPARVALLMESVD